MEYIAFYEDLWYDMRKIKRSELLCQIYYLFALFGYQLQVSHRIVPTMWWNNKSVAIIELLRRYQKYDSGIHMRAL